MKKHILIITAIMLLPVYSCSAQTEDCIIAKWEKGYGADYTMEGTTLEVSEAGDTTVTSTGTYDFSVMVLDADKSGYKLRLEYPTSLYTSNMEIDLSDIGKTIPIDFETDEFGIFERVTNTDFLINLSERLIDAMVKLPQFSDMDESDLRSMLNSIMSPERMVQSFSQDINVLLWPYGVAAEEGETLSFESSVNVGSTEIPTTSYVLLEPFKEGDMFKVIKMVTEYDKNSMGPFLTQFFGQMMSGVEDKGKYNQEEFENFMKNAQMSIIDSSVCVLDPETTFPFMASYERHVEMTTDGKTSSKIQRRELMIH